MEDLLFGLMMILFFYIGYRYMNRVDHIILKNQVHKGLALADKDDLLFSDIDLYKSFGDIDYDHIYQYAILTHDDDFKNLMSAYKLKRIYPQIIIYSLCNNMDNRKIYLKNNIIIIEESEIQNIISQYQLMNN